MGRNKTKLPSFQGVSFGVTKFNSSSRQTPAFTARRKNRSRNGSLFQRSSRKAESRAGFPFFPRDATCQCQFYELSETFEQAANVKRNFREPSAIPLVFQISHDFSKLETNGNSDVKRYERRQNCSQST